MARYAIVKLYEIESDGMLANMFEAIKHYGVVLSPEETEAKWKEMWQNGIELEYDRFKDAIPDDYPNGEEMYQRVWDNLKKTL